MNVALRKPRTVAEFLAWEERQELGYEFDSFQRVAAFTDGMDVHEAIGGILREQLRDRETSGILSNFFHPALPHPGTGQHCGHGLRAAGPELGCACAGRGRPPADGGNRH
jgi:hypothetical protein